MIDLQVDRGGYATASQIYPISHIIGLRETDEIFNILENT